MSLGLYVDECVHGSIVRGLRQRNVDVLTAQEDGYRQTKDDLILDRATALSRLLFTQDEDHLADAHRRQKAGAEFAGVVYGHQRAATIGRFIRDLELIAKASDLTEYANRVQFLPF